MRIKDNTTNPACCSWTWWLQSIIFAEKRVNFIGSAWDILTQSDTRMALIVTAPSQNDSFWHYFKANYPRNYWFKIIDLINKLWSFQDIHSFACISAKRFSSGTLLFLKWWLHGVGYLRLCLDMTHITGSLSHGERCYRLYLDNINALCHLGLAFRTKIFNVWCF